MALFDFIGSQPDQLTPGEVFSGLAEAIGPVLVQRGRKLGLPIGLGLTAFGGLGELLAKKQADYGKQQGLVKALQSLQDPLKGTGLKPSDIAPESQGALKPDFTTFATTALQGGATPAEIEGLWKSAQGPNALKPFPIFNPKTNEERMYDPNSGQPIPQGFVSSSFYKPEKQGKEVPFDVWQQQNPGAPISDYFKLTHPTMNINVETPRSPSDIVKDKETGLWGFYETDKAGNVRFTPTGTAPPERLPTPEKPKEAKRGQMIWKKNTYTYVDNPDGSRIATPSTTDPWFGPPLKKKLFFPPGSSSPIEIPLGASIGKH